MPLFYRIVQEPWVAGALTGEGARRHGGRWNLPGVAAVYLAQTRALAALEILVHAPREALRLDWMIIELEIAESLIDRVPHNRLPEKWRNQPSSKDAMAFGSRWLRDAPNLSLLLPSVVIPEENTLLLNPSHSGMNHLKSSNPRPFSFDPRLAV